MLVVVCVCVCVRLFQKWFHGAKAELIPRLVLLDSLVVSYETSTLTSILVAVSYRERNAESEAMLEPAPTL